LAGVSHPPKLELTKYIIQIKRRGQKKLYGKNNPPFFRTKDNISSYPKKPFFLELTRRAWVGNKVTKRLIGWNSFFRCDCTLHHLF
jgi:hypothetical protein